MRQDLFTTQLLAQAMLNSYKRDHAFTRLLDREPAPPLTLRRRLAVRWRDALRRVQRAWLALTDRLD
jgi:uncharacterized protein YecT (DUF1311 family)